MAEAKVITCDEYLLEKSKKATGLPCKTVREVSNTFEGMVPLPNKREAGKPSKPGSPLVKVEKPREHCDKRKKMCTKFQFKELIEREDEGWVILPTEKILPAEAMQTDDTWGEWFKKKLPS
jgi:hypothetical protein